MLDPIQPSDEDTFRKLAWYTQRKPVFTGGNQVALLRGGQSLFPALCAAIDAARKSVWMAFYMVSANGQGDTVLQALKAAARRGVTVHFVADGLGSHNAPDALWQELEAAGVKMTLYRPMHRLWTWLDPRQLRRMHMKLCGGRRAGSLRGWHQPDRRPFRSDARLDRCAAPGLRRARERPGGHARAAHDQGDVDAGQVRRGLAR
ncbi:MAG: phospholipase D-like domain-containing protein [Aquabacterium sp.]